MNSIFGQNYNYKFTDVYEDVDEFLDDWKESPYYEVEGLAGITDGMAGLTYHLLYANYGNSTIANFDTNQFKFKLFSIMWMYGPIWAKKLKVQSDLRELSIEEIKQGTRAIYNHTLNDGSLIPTSDTLLDHINEQNTTKYEKSKIDALVNYYDTISNDITKDYIRKFSKLFVLIAEPNLPLFYSVNEDDAVLEGE